MSDSPYENTRSHKKKDGDTPISENAPIPVDLKTEETPVRVGSLREIMKEGKKARAKREQKLENELNSMMISAVKSPKETRLPKLKYDELKPSECGKHVGLVFDSRMMLHKASKTLDYGRKHPERPERISRPLERLCGAAMLDRLYLIAGREATEDDLLLVHQKDHIVDMASTADLEIVDDFEEKQASYDSIYLCKESYMSALLSCGSTLSIVEEVVIGSLDSGFALVRPPGHHAETHTACGFCLFNNVAVAARYAQKIAKKIGLTDSEEKYKVLILDWDVHHGNGTQRMFYDDSSILYISFHRYDNGIFFPSSDEANYDKVGNDKGLGFNINIPWSGGRMGNSEYYTAFERIVMPVADEYKPDLVLVSSGFDAGKGDPLGGYYVTPNMYGYMTHRLQSLAKGKVVVVLEGGYNLTTVSDSVLACVESLLEYSNSSRESENLNIENIKYNIPPRMKRPNLAGLSCVLQVLDFIISFWPCLETHKSKVCEILQDMKRLAAEKLMKNDDCDEDINIPDSQSSTKRHSYGTRSQSSKKYQNRTSSNSNSDANALPSTLNSIQNIKFSTPNESATNINQNPGITTVENTAFSMDELKNALLDAESSQLSNHSDDSYYSAASSVGGGGEPTPRTPFATPTVEDKATPLSRMDGSYLDAITDKRGSIGKFGGASAETEKSVGSNTRKEITMVLSAMGFNNTDTDEMSLEDMVAIAQATLPEHASGYTVPKDSCPHVDGDVNLKTMDSLNLDTFCAMCEYVIENWTCLKCGEYSSRTQIVQVFCGRFVNAHMLDHYNETKHAVVLSHSDLSFWCYECDAYLNNYTIKVLHEVYRRSHVLKHNLDLPS